MKRSIARRAARGRLGALVVAAVITGSSRGLAQSPPLPPAGDPPSRIIFRPLLADLKEPRFFAAYLWERASRLAPRLGAVGFGQTIGLLEGADWQLAIAAAVFSQFNMQSSTTDLMNTDYVVGFPLMYRRGGLVTRFRLYHQSSHLGDGYIVHSHAQQVMFSVEAADLILSDEMANWRLYGGGEYRFTRAPDDLRRGILHGGVEYRGRGTVVRLGRLASGRFVAALDGKSTQEHHGQIGWSLVTGLELSDPLAPRASGWRWSVLLEGYNGPSPYGQFYRDYVSSLGLGVEFTF